MIKILKYFSKKEDEESGIILEKSSLDKKIFTDENYAYRFLENYFWKIVVICPHCGGGGNSSLLKGKSTRLGLYKCYDCRRPFTVLIGTIFEKSHVKINLWLKTIYLIHENDVSATFVSECLGMPLKSSCRILNIWERNKYRKIYKDLYWEIRKS